MLVKLDQDTAQALQNHPQILTRSTVFDGNRNELNHSHQDVRDSQIVNDLKPDEDRLLNNTENDIQYDAVIKTECPKGGNGIADSEQTSSEDHVHDRINKDVRQSDALRSNTPERDVRNDRVTKPVSNVASDSPSQSRKFKLQTSKLRPALHNDVAKAALNHTNGYRGPLERDGPLISLGADDIRASINRSLQEYSQSSSQVGWREEILEPTTYSSHFDNQPNLISSPTADDNDSAGRLHSSPSFSIDVPDDSDQSTNITSQILKQSALRKKSPFNLHKVINKLASQRGHSQSLLGDKTKIRLRRAQMRAASYLRRMNYYFQAYPTMKYWMIGYLVILQILVVYVLFFYQSSGSSSYLTNQVKQQQQELAEPSQHPNSERLHPYSSDQDINRLR